MAGAVVASVSYMVHRKVELWRGTVCPAPSETADEEKLLVRRI